MENLSFGFDTFISPLTWRYGSGEMKEIWSEENKRKLLRKVWVALAFAQNKAGIVSDKQLSELIAHQNDINIPRSLEIEAEIHHDLMAEIRTYAEQCPLAGGIIHLGATSMDILDNADALRLVSSLLLTEKRLNSLCSALCSKIKLLAKIPCMAFTHIQSAEVSTVGYRLAQTAQDLTDNLLTLRSVLSSIKGKGFKGAVGSMASYDCLLEKTGFSASEMEALAMKQLNLESFEASTQVYPRSQDVKVMQALDALCCTLSKFALDFRLMQSTAIGEWSEPFGKNQVGSSAMPFKRNPINCEKADGLCRYVHNLANNAWENASLCILERTLDDSSNRRLYLPQAFLAIDEILITLEKVISGMNIHNAAIKRNLDAYGVFSATEKLLMTLGARGADRQKMHEVIRQASLKAWNEVQEGRANPLKDLLSSDPEVLAFVSKEEVLNLLDASDYVGQAPQRAILVAEKLQALLN